GGQARLEAPGAAVFFRRAAEYDIDATFGAARPCTDNNVRITIAVDIGGRQRRTHAPNVVQAIVIANKMETIRSNTGSAIEIHRIGEVRFLAVYQIDKARTCRTAPIVRRVSDEDIGNTITIKVTHGYGIA